MIDWDKIENAIRHIETALDVDPWACEIAVKAMKRQLPQKPRHIDKNGSFDGNFMELCPTCGLVLFERVTTEYESYPKILRKTPCCMNCGQAIEWERA